MRKQNGSLKPANLNKTVNDLLQATALNKRREIYPKEATALQSLGVAASAH